MTMGNKHSGLRHFKINFYLSCSTMAKDFFKMLPQILYRQPLHGKQEKNDFARLLHETSTNKTAEGHEQNYRFYL